MVRLVAFILLAMARRDSAWIPRHEYMSRAQVIVAGEVIGFEKDPKGQEFALLKPRFVLKGECNENPVKLPVMKKPEVGCDDRIPYREGYKFIILIDEQLPSRAMPYGSILVDRLDGDEITIVKITLDVLAGHVGRRTPDLLKMLESPTVQAHVKRDACELVRILSRKQARPLLPAVRKAYGPWGYPAGPVKGSLLVREAAYRIPEIADVVLDFSLVPELLRLPTGDEDKLLHTLSRVCARSFESRKTFEAWWARAVEQSRATGTPADAEKYLPLWKSADPATREAGSRKLLDLGPSILPVVEPLAKDQDTEVRARAAQLVDELLLLRDLRDELKP